MGYIVAIIIAIGGIGAVIRFRRRSTHIYPSPESLIIQPESDLPVESRILRLEGGVNFRDVGGYKTKEGRRVKTGVVYRSGALGQLTEGDWQRLRALKLSMICDLRGEEEVLVEPDNPPFEVPYRHLRMEAEPPRFARLRGLFFSQKQLAELLPYVYKTLLVDQSAVTFGNTLRLLADVDNLPIVIHCTAGKDRTGVSTALLLMLLGVPDDVIAADYSLSNLYFDRFYEVAEIALKPLSVVGFSADDVTPMLTADVRTIQATIDHVRDTYGSVERYLIDAAGLTEDELAQIKANLLE